MRKKDVIDAIHIVREATKHRVNERNKHMIVLLERGDLSEVAHQSIRIDEDTSLEADILNQMGMIEYEPNKE